jgi:transcriptional regulator with XRE-family HTH domain
MNHGESSKVFPTLSEVIGRQIRKAREDRRLSQDDLAEKIGSPFDQATVSLLESGKRRATVNDIYAVAVALRVSPLWLLSGAYTNESVPITPDLPASPAKVQFWLKAEAALDAESQELFFELVPDEERLMRRWRAVESLLRIVRTDLRDGVRRAARQADFGVMTDAVKDMRRELEWLQQEIEHEQERATRARKEE